MMIIFLSYSRVIEASQRPDRGSEASPSAKLCRARMRKESQVPRRASYKRRRDAGDGQCAGHHASHAALVTP